MDMILGNDHHKPIFGKVSFESTVTNFPFNFQVAGFVYSIEFQKRGMPHCHMLLFMEKGHEPNTPEKIDELVWARIPDEPSPDDPEERKIFLRALHRAVLRHMIHSRCKGVDSAYCNAGKKEHWTMCSKRFPKPYSEFTIIGDNNYAVLARPKNGPVVHKDAYGEKNVAHDCQWVVSYNPTLLVALDSHVNVEV